MFGAIQAGVDVKIARTGLVLQLCECRSSRVRFGALNATPSKSQII